MANMEDKREKSHLLHRSLQQSYYEKLLVFFLLLPTNTKSTLDESACKLRRDFLLEKLVSGEATGALMRHRSEVYSHFAQAGTILSYVNRAFFAWKKQNANHLPNSSHVYINNLHPSDF